MKLPKFPRIRRSAASPEEQPAPHFCAKCGAVLGQEIQAGQPCPACEAQLAVLLETPAASMPLSHQTAFKEAVDRKVSEGWYIVRQLDAFTEMRKPKGKINPAMLLGSLAAGVPLPGSFFIFGGAYVAWHVLKNEQGVHLFVSSDGKVCEEKTQ